MPTPSRRPQASQPHQYKPLALALALALGSPVLLANPNGATVVRGSASIASNGDTLTVTNSPGAIINWQNFSIAGNELTRFVQQNAASTVLNRVTGGNPSSILGGLQSNGHVWLINPNGIVFGSGARIDVAGLVASSLNITDQDFANGLHKFTGAGGAGAVRNAGHISASGGPVLLFAPDVENSGIITSPNGEIILAAGHSVELANSSNPALRVTVTAGGEAVNLGQIIAQGGNASMVGGLVRQAGLVSASSVTREGGRVYLRATGQVQLDSNSRTEANGTSGGSILARVEDNGQLSGRIEVQGALSAQGDGSPDSGGFVDTSAAEVRVGEVKVDTGGGKWLIDPADFTIAASGGNISGSTLSGNLAGGSIEIQSSSGTAGGNGDIHVNDDVSWSANTLTLTAARDVNINAVMTASGTSSLVLNPAATNGADTAVADGTVKVGFNPDGSFKGRVDFPGRTGAGFLAIGGQGYTVIDSLGVAGSTTALDLQGMNGGLGGYYALGSNIDASATSGWNWNVDHYDGFAPIGPTFSGSFDGLGHTITGLFVNRPTTYDVGLFRSVGFTGAVRNVGLLGGSVTGQQRVGGLAGTGNGTITNSFVTSAVNGLSHVGGLVGEHYGVISNSYTTGAVSGEDYVGGLAGLNYWGEGTVSDSYATGAVSGNRYVGGLVGYNAFEISNSYATGTVTGTGVDPEAIGGLAGYNDWGTISDSHAEGAVAGTVYVGGLVGENDGDISNSYATGDVTGVSGTASYAGYSDYIGGLVGLNWSEGSVIDSYAEGSVTGSWDVGGLVGYSEGWVSGSHATGAVSGEWAVGGLAGYNRGNIDSGYATGHVTGFESGSIYIGGLVGYNDSYEINTSYATGNVTGAEEVGGLVGKNWNGSIIDSHATGAVSGTSLVGGLVGWNSQSDINGSYATGDVTGLGGASQYIGGLVGYNDTEFGMISGSYASGVVSGDYYVGGLVGAHEGVISSSHATGAVSGTSYVGGLVGSTIQDVGNAAQISTSYATGAVSGEWFVGGLAGLVDAAGTVSNSYATGSVTGIDALSGPSVISESVGGLVGNNQGTINTSYASGAVTGSVDVGGLAGYNIGTVNGSYWDIETTGQATSAGGTGLTNAQMKQQASFAGWDFAETWGIDEAMSYPYLLANEQLPHPGYLGPVYWDGEAGDGLWTSVLNWNINALPGVDDDVAIGTGSGTVTLTSGLHAAINALMCEADFVIDGGSLTIGAGGAYFSGSLELVSGGLSGNGTGELGVTGGFSQASGFDVSGFNHIFISQLTGNLSVGNLSTTWSGNFDSASSNGVIGLRAEAGDIVQQAGTVLAGSGLGVAASGSVLLEENNPTGVIGGSAGGDFRYKSSAPILVTSYDDGNYALSGITVGNGIQLTSTTGDIFIDAPLQANLDIILITPTQAVFNVDWSPLGVANNLSVQGVGGVGGDLVNTATMTLDKGVSVSADGKLVNAAGASLSMTDPLASIAVGGDIKNQGSMHLGGGSDLATGVSGGFINSGSLLLDGDATSVLVYQNFSNQAGGTVTIQGTNTTLDIDGSLINAGSLTLAGTASSLLAWEGVDNQATGSISIQAGTAFDVSGGAFANAGSLIIASGGALDVLLGMTNAAGGDILNNGTLTATTLTLNGGLLHGAGTLTADVVNTGGTVSPGNSVGTLTIVGDYTQGAGGTLNIEIGGTAAGEYDVLAVSGDVTLDGTLTAGLVNGFIPVHANYFSFLTAGGTTTGTFATLTAPTAFSVGYNLATNEAARLIYALDGANTFTNAAGGLSWGIAQNWSFGVLPGEADDVLISAGHAVIHDSGDDLIASLTISSGNALDVSGGSLTVSGDTLVVGALSVSGGSLALNGLTNSIVDLSVSSGSLSIASGLTQTAGSFTQTGGSVQAAHLIVDGGVANLNGGTFSSTGGVSVGALGTLKLAGGTLDTGSVVNAGTFDIHADTTIHADFSNSGTVNKLAGAGTTTFNGSFASTGTINIDIGSLAFAGGLTQNGGVLTVNGGLLGNVLLNGGLLNGSGTIGGNVTLNGGTLAPGNSPGVLNITGDLTLGSTSTLIMELGDPAYATANDQINVGGLFTQGGTLQLSAVNGYVPVPEDSFVLFTFGSESGSFASMSLPNETVGLSGGVLRILGQTPIDVPVVPEYPEVTVTVIDQILRESVTQVSTGGGFLFTVKPVADDDEDKGEGNKSTRMVCTG